MDTIKIEYTKEQKELIDATLLKGCSEYEKMQVWHLADKYGLDLLQKGQIWVTGFGNQKNIIVGRDGMLTIAHRCGGIKYFESEAIWRKDDEYHEQDPIGAYCIIERLDTGARFKQSANFREYNSGKALWATKPSEMITKVAESKCLRRAFDMSGFYSQEELDDVKMEARAERDNAIEKAEKEYDGALFKSRKEREVEAQQKPVEKKVETPKQEPAPATVTLPYNEYDLANPYLTLEQMADMVTDIKLTFKGQSVSKDEIDACRRQDGNFDRHAAEVLKKIKYNAFKEGQAGGKA